MNASDERFAADLFRSAAPDDLAGPDVDSVLTGGRRLVRRRQIARAGVAVAVPVVVLGIGLPLSHQLPANNPPGAIVAVPAEQTSTEQVPSDDGRALPRDETAAPATNPSSGPMTVSPDSHALSATIGTGKRAIQPWYDVTYGHAGIALGDAAVLDQWNVPAGATSFLMAGVTQQRPSPGPGASVDPNFVIEQVTVGFVNGSVDKAVCNGDAADVAALGDGWTAFGVRAPIVADRPVTCSWTGPDGVEHALEPSAADPNWQPPR